MAQVESSFKLVGRKDLLLEGEFTHRLPGFIRLLGQFGRSIVADGAGPEPWREKAIVRLEQRFVPYWL